jgi:hypothetical protein
VSPVGVDRCPECGYPLVLVQPQARTEEVDAELIVKPGDRTRDQADVDTDDTAVLTAGRTPAPHPQPAVVSRAAAGGLVCPSCHQANSPERDRWCEWCGADMNPPVTTAIPERVAVAPPGDRRRPVWLLWVGGAALVVAGVVLALVLGPLSGDDPTHEPVVVTVTSTNGTSAPSGSAGTPQPAESVLAASGITAKASSTLQLTDHPGYYSIRNTLDGKADTAWNSDSDVVGNGVGVTLTYRFGRPVQLHAISVRNGYVSSRVASVGTKVWGRNERLKQVLVTTDAGRVVWDLDDKPTPQTKHAAFGTTSTVRIVVRAVYPGSSFEDLALTDIAFTGVG